MTAAAIALAILEHSAGSLDEKGQRALSDAIGLTSQASSELRSIAYVLHPPMLENQGLTATLTWYVDSFALRSGIEVRLNLSPELGSLPREVATALFRIVQEGLSNVHKHSKSAWVQISLSSNGGDVTLEIKDGGQGMHSQIVAAAYGNGNGLGLGLAEILCRIRQLEGQFKIESGSQGTTLRVVLPFESKRPLAEPQ